MQGSRAHKMEKIKSLIRGPELKREPAKGSGLTPDYSAGGKLNKVEGLPKLPKIGV